MSLQYIIDGCNVIHSTVFRNQKAKRHSDSRLLLIEIIKQYKLCGSENNKVTVVFDGYPDKTLGEIFGQGLKVLFSFDKSADDTIRDMLETSNNTKNTVVVSDDKEIVLCSRLFLAKPLSVKDFIVRGVRSQKDKTESREKEVTFSQMHKINEELKKIWLR